MTQLVELADEFDLTTVEALEVCDQIGVTATTSEYELDGDEVIRFRAAADALIAARTEQVAARSSSGLGPLAPLVSQTDFTQVPDEWQAAGRVPPPPTPGSGGRERTAVLAVVAAGAGIVIALITGLCGVLFSLVPIGLSVKAKNAMAGKSTSGAALVVVARLGAVASIVIGLGVTWIVYRGDIDRLPTLVVLDAFVPGELRAADSVEVGDCVREPDSLPGATELQVVQVVSCTGEHDVEYFAKLETYGITPMADMDGAFPGDESIRSVMFAECAPLWEDFVDAPLGASELDLAVSYPTERAWGSGDRLLLCGVASTDGSSLEGSMIGAGR